MEVIVPILVQLIAGGIGGNVIGQVVKSLNLGPAGGLDLSALAGQGATGLVGGGILTAIAGIIKSSMAKA